MENSWPGGVRRAMDQSEHERWNASHYPGTRQMCSVCDEPTGRCEEDSMWSDCGEPLCVDCNQIHGESLARQAFLGFAKAYKYDIAFDADEHEYCDPSTQRAWAAFWSGWESRNDEMLAVNKEEIQGELRAAGINMEPAKKRLHEMIDAKRKHLS